MSLPPEVPLDLGLVFAFPASISCLIVPWPAALIRGLALSRSRPAMNCRADLPGRKVPAGLKRQMWADREFRRDFPSLEVSLAFPMPGLAPAAGNDGADGELADTMRAFEVPRFCLLCGPLLSLSPAMSQGDLRRQAADALGQGRFRHPPVAGVSAPADGARRLAEPERPLGLCADRQRRHGGPGGLCGQDPGAVSLRVGAFRGRQAQHRRPAALVPAAFTVPAAWRANGQHVLLHFGAVNWDSTVSRQRQARSATHKGGYDAFDLDVTAALKPGANELVVSAWNPLPMTRRPAAPGHRQAAPASRRHLLHGLHRHLADGLAGTGPRRPYHRSHITPSRTSTPDVLHADRARPKRSRRSVRVVGHWTTARSSAARPARRTPMSPAGPRRPPVVAG